jgi:hypothetical protein
MQSGVRSLLAGNAERHFTLQTVNGDNSANRIALSVVAQTKTLGAVYELGADPSVGANDFESFERCSLKNSRGSLGGTNERESRSNSSLEKEHRLLRIRAVAARTLKNTAFRR